MKEEIFEDLFKNVVVCGRYPYEKLEEMRCYLNSLVDANEILKSQLKAKEEVIKEARETIETKIQKSFAYDYGLYGVDAASKDRLFTETVIELQLIDEILSKGENKEIEFDVLKALNEDLDDDVEMSNM